MNHGKSNKKTTWVVSKAKKEPTYSVAITSTVHKATASELALFRQCFNQDLSKKKKHVVVHGNTVITTWKWSLV
jgi:hypothetical protein